MHMEGVHGATESSSASTGASASGAVPVIDVGIPLVTT